MDTQTKETLEVILSKDKNTLSREELGFVMARRSYLNDVDQKRFAEEIKLHEKGELFPVIEEGGDDLDGMKLAELKQLAKDMKLTVSGKTENAFRKAIRESREADEE